MIEFKEIRSSQTPIKDLSDILELVHTHGPSNSDILERISAYKLFHPKAFSEFEEKIISSMGLFYKIDTPKNLYSFIVSGIGDYTKTVYGKSLTPVQASVRRAVEEKQFVSISAPTSAGKSYSIRDFIATQTGDAVVVVPSRALIAEYMNSIRSAFVGRKDVMISSFVDKVYTSRELRRIYVLTPERARELFSLGSSWNIETFFFDEAQVSEDKDRGVIFDVVVRRAMRSFPKAKLIFAHPFVDNPGAQFMKHGISEERSYSKSYVHGAVGKICIFRHNNDNDYYFSPYAEKGYLLRNSIPFGGKFEDFAFSESHSILIYVSKESIYNDKFIEDFQVYVDKFPDVKDERALGIIDSISNIIGADDNEHDSKLVRLLKKGVVIHHGSVPLEVRFLLEDFIRGRYARICFATSTLAQGVNMPFDIVWLRSMHIGGGNNADRSMAFKNLIGRAGRLSDDRIFDYGYVFTESPKIFVGRIKDTYRLSETSVIESDEPSADDRELIDAIKNNTLSENYNIPLSKAERLAAPSVLASCKFVLDAIYAKESISQSISGPQNKELRKSIREHLSSIFCASINRSLHDGENAVFSMAIRIFLLLISDKTFKEIAGIRFNYISRRRDGRKGRAAFSQRASKLPDSGLIKPYPLFKNTLANEISYDAVIFDTYDYMDQVISFSLSDTLSAAFKIYGEKTLDGRSKKMLELLRFGTNNIDHILLMRYGFSPEIIADVLPYIRLVNENEIVFFDTIESAPERIRDSVEWYLP
jgi:hypothetical protein